MIMLNRDRMAGGAPDGEGLQDALREFRATLPGLERLAQYYNAKHDVLGRARLEGLPNNHLVHAFPRYIATISASYLLGEPVRVQGPEPEVRELRALLLRACADSVDLELAIAQSVFGRAVSLCYEDRAGKPFACALDPRTAFVVYDDTVEHAPLFGVYLTNRQGRETVTVYTAEHILTYTENLKGFAAVDGHFFGSLPMVEYLNGPDAHGDFEDVLSLIDAYDLLECDRLNDRQQFSDALLVLTGVMGIGTDPAAAATAYDRLRQERTLALPDADAKAEWLTKNPQEHDVDILRRALAEDIHKFSLTPDFSDERFAGNASGIAIKYKLFNFDNRVKMKERFYVTGLRERARAFCGWLKNHDGLSLDADLLGFQMSRRLPVNEAERAQSLAALKDVLPTETLLFNSPFLAAP